MIASSDLKVINAIDVETQSFSSYLESIQLILILVKDSSNSKFLWKLLLDGSKNVGTVEQQYQKDHVDFCCLKQKK